MLGGMVLPPEALNGGWRLATKPVTFTGAAGAGAVGTVEIITATGGAIAVRFKGIKCTTNIGAGGAATIALGFTGSPTALRGTNADAREWDAGEWWNDDDEGDSNDFTTTTRHFEVSGIVIVPEGCALILTIGDNALVSGATSTYYDWQPVEDAGVAA